MSILTERLMRGEYISKAECFEHDEEITRTMDAYPRAMAAMEEHDRMMAACACEYDGGYGDDGSQGRRFPNQNCPVHAQEDSE